MTCYFLGRKIHHLIFVVWLFAFSILAHAQVYKWIDEGGKILYSDQPPIEKNIRNEQKLEIQSVPVEAPADDVEKIGASRSLAEERLEYDKRRQQRKEKQARLKAEAEHNKKQCVKAQSRLRLFLEAPRLRVPDGSGGIIWADDDLRQQKINEAKAVIESYCE